MERKALTITVNAREPFPAEPSDEAMADVALRFEHFLKINFNLEKIMKKF